MGGTKWNKGGTSEGTYGPVLHSSLDDLVVYGLA